jgi:hypothetical protein
MKDSSGKSWQLAAGAGKDSNLYIVNRNSTGKFNPRATISIGNFREFCRWNLVHAGFFAGKLYFGPVGQTSLAFQYKNAQLLPAPVAQTGNSFAYPGATPSNSANKRPERYRLGLQAPSGGAPRSSEPNQLGSVRARP